LWNSTPPAKLRTLRFLGIDFGWENKPSGLAALEWDGGLLHLRSLQRLTNPRQIVDWADAEAGPDAIAGIDAPIVIPNATGMRDADKLAHSLYGRYHAGAYPASRARRFWKRTTGLSTQLLKRGFQHGDTLPHRAMGRHQIEVHPHAAAVQLFALNRIVKYKKGSLASRVAELDRLRSLMLERFPRLIPSLAMTALPETPRTGAALKDLEDRLDAITCAYVAAHWWFWGAQRNDVLGNARDGYIIVPKRQAWHPPLADLREAYSHSGLLESDLHPDPIVQFQKWFSEARAAALHEANAMTLATVSADGQPSARMVLLKGVDARGFVFYTNYESRKARELDANPRAALVFYWPELHRQVRVTGEVRRVSRDESAAYFRVRPRASQLSALASRQSDVIAGRGILEARVRELEAEYDGQPVPPPEFWGGYRLRPRVMEFWQGRPNRLHDRLSYSRKNSATWRIERLSP
jgi:pyridoxamine 5'-phosphate oxidase